MVAALHMMFTNTQVHTHKRSLVQNEGEWVIMGLVLASAVACLSAVVMELSTAKTLTGVARHFQMRHASFTLATSWLFTQVMFA
jgi:uncharacterized membrane protein